MEPSIPQALPWLANGDLPLLVLLRAYTYLFYSRRRIYLDTYLSKLYVPPQCFTFCVTYIVSDRQLPTNYFISYTILKAHVTLSTQDVRSAGYHPNTAW